MMRALRHFKANMSMPEAARRVGAVEAALRGDSPVRVLPPPMPCPLAPQALTLPELIEELSEPDAPVVDLAVVDQVPRRPRWEPDRPAITIEISGASRSGKSVLSHVILAALANEGIAVTVIDELRPIRWRGRGGALDNLVDRGVSVVLVRRETE